MIDWQRQDESRADVIESEGGFIRHNSERALGDHCLNLVCVGGNAEWCSHCGKQYGDTSKNQK